MRLPTSPSRSAIIISNASTRVSATLPPATSPLAAPRKYATKGVVSLDAGALQRLLQPLAEEGVTMTRIESRPSHRRKWHYVFFVDIDGHCEDEHVARALAHLEKGAQLFRILGSYPKAVL